MGRPRSAANGPVRRALDVIEAELSKDAPADAQRWAAALVLKTMGAQERPNEPTTPNKVQQQQMFDNLI